MGRRRFAAAALAQAILGTACGAETATVTDPVTGADAAAVTDTAAAADVAAATDTATPLPCPAPAMALPPAPSAAALDRALRARRGRAGAHRPRALLVVVVNVARSVAARWPLCHAVLCDADPPLLRALPRPEVETGGWVAALAGGALFLSDDLRALPAERRAWAVDAPRSVLALGGAPGRPVDPVPVAPPPLLVSAVVDHVSPTTTQVVPRIRALPDGGRARVNWSEAEATIDGVVVPPHAAVAGDAP